MLIFHPHLWVKSQTFTCSQIEGQVFLCGEMRFVVLPWCHDVKMALQALVVVVPDIGLDHLDKLVSARERPPIVTLPLQDPPEAFHRTVVNAAADAGHALRHAVLHELRMERTIRVLAAPIAVEQGMRVGVLRHGLVKRVEYEAVVVVVAQLECYDPVIEEVEDGTQVELVHILTVRVLELRDIGQPFLVLMGGILCTRKGYWLK